MTPARLHQVAMRDLVRQIVRGDLAPGDALPKELDLAEQYGISRGVARESIRGLEERRLIEVRHGRGQRVTDPDTWDLSDGEVLSAMMDTDSDGTMLAEVLETQRIFEIQAAGIAATNASPEDIDALTATLDALEAAAALAPRSEIATARYIAERANFHRRVIRAAGNRALVGLTDQIYRALSTIKGELEPAELEAEIGEFRAILTAIADGDEAAAMEAVDEHLVAFARRLSID